MMNYRNLLLMAAVVSSLASAQSSSPEGETTTAFYETLFARMCSEGMRTCMGVAKDLYTKTIESIREDCASPDTASTTQGKEAQSVEPNSKSFMSCYRAHIVSGMNVPLEVFRVCRAQESST